MRSCLLAFVSAALLVAADGADKDAQAIKGTWKLTRTISDGEERKGNKDDWVIITGDTITSRLQGEPESVMTYRLDSAARPPAMDIHFALGDGFVLIRAIYKLEGDTLTICYSLDGDPRPTTFHAAKGSGQGLVVLERR
jgi:uncharacterized protein (TIGR03067 family)